VVLWLASNAALGDALAAGAVLLASALFFWLNRMLRRRAAIVAS
jgi:hypothetical protein